MAKRPPIDLQAALEAAKAKLGQPVQDARARPRAAVESTKLITSDTARPKRTPSKDEGSLTLEKLAKAWAQTKNFPKTH